MSHLKIVSLYVSSENCIILWGGTSDLYVHFIRKYELISGLGLASQRSLLRKTSKFKKEIKHAFNLNAQVSHLDNNLYTLGT